MVGSVAADLHARVVHLAQLRWCHVVLGHEIGFALAREDLAHELVEYLLAERIGYIEIESALEEQGRVTVALVWVRQRLERVDAGVGQHRVLHALPEQRHCPHTTTMSENMVDAMYAKE